MLSENTPGREAFHAKRRFRRVSLECLAGRRL